MPSLKRDNPTISLVVLCASALLFGLLMLRGVGGEAKAKGADLSQHHIAVAKADVYWIEVECVRSNPSPEPEPVECACGGSKTTGDGISPCPCITNGGKCNCAKHAEPPVVEPTVEPVVVIEPTDVPVVPEDDPALLEGSTTADDFPYTGPLIDGKYHLIVKSHPACIPCIEWKKVDLPVLEKRGVKVQLVDVPFENVPRFVYANDPKQVNHVGRKTADEIIKKLLGK